MNKEQTQTMMKYLLGFGYYWGGRYDDDYVAGDCLSIPSKYNLGGTPLDHAILTMPTIVDNFNSKNRVQKTNFQLEQENKAAEEAKAKAESEAKEQAAKDQADAYKKKRTAMVGSRSLFANPGGRGFFD